MSDVIEINTISSEAVEIVEQGPQGAPGVGVPTGGIRLQVLRKKSSTDYDTEWSSSGGGSVDLSSPDPIGDVTPNTGAFTSLTAVTANFTTISASGTATLPHIHGALAGNLYLHVKNVSGGELARGTPVYVVGNVGDTDRVEVAAADFDDATKMPAVGLLEQTLANNGTGDAVIVGELSNANTGSYSLNQELFVGNNGALTTTRPTTGEVQSVGTVGRVHASTGVIVVNVQGRRSPNETFALVAHTHPASDITSGTLLHERGGLEADVSAYNGLVKIASGSTSAVTVTSAGEALLDDADAAAQRTTLGLGTAATAATGDFAAASHTHGNLTNDGKLGTTAGLPVVTTTAGAVTTLALGTANQVLRVNSGASGVEFADPSGGGVTGAASSASDVLGVSGANITGVDANADRIVFWDDSASALKYLEAGSGLSISGTTLSTPSMSGATNSAAGATGLVPQPASGSQGRVLMGDAAFASYVMPSGGSYGSDFIGFPRITGSPVFNGSSLNVTANTLVRGGCFYFRGTFNRISVYVTAGSAGKNARIGIYEISDNGYETSLVTSGIVGLDNMGFAEATVSSFSLESKFYVTAVLIDSSGASLHYGANNTVWNRPFDAYTNVNGSPNLGATMTFGGFYTRQYADGLPSSLPTSGYTSYNTAIVFVRKV